MENAEAFTVRKRDGHSVMQIKSPVCEGELSLYGGHLMSWKPRAQEEVLWLSPAVKIEDGKSIRGGVPVCWPWFGPNPSDSSSPAHGFARLFAWDLESFSLAPDGSAEIALSLAPSSVPAAFKTRVFGLRLRISMGASLSISLESSNPGASPFQFSAGLHTYFRVGEISQSSVMGLDGASYLDKNDGQVKTQAGVLQFNGKVDRIYRKVAGASICDKALKRTIRVENEGCSSLVVWNPGEGVELQFPGFSKGDERHFVCVEAAQPELLSLKQGESHLMRTKVSLA